MTITRLLDRSQEVGVADAVSQVLDETGYTIEEAIPGLIREIIILARLTPYPEELLEEAADLLADGTLDEEDS